MKSPNLTLEQKAGILACLLHIYRELLPICDYDQYQTLKLMADATQQFRHDLSINPNLLKEL